MNCKETNKLSVSSQLKLIKKRIKIEASRGGFFIYERDLHEENKVALSKAGYVVESEVRQSLFSVEYIAQKISWGNCKC